jgi:ATP-dependent RNA circularization protein (DNA/RNA ligase family)
VHDLVPQIGEFCCAHPGYVLYGEAYGTVQSLRYGCSRGQVKFAAFDVFLPDGTFAPAARCRELCAWHGVPQVPLLGGVPFDLHGV